MRRRLTHLVALTVAICGISLAAAFGDQWQQIGAYGLAIALGVLVYIQGERHLVPGTSFGTVLQGYAAGIMGSLLIGTGLLSWLLSIPVDFALWRTGLLMWGSWLGIGAAILATFFVYGSLAVLR